MLTLEQKWDRRVEEWHSHVTSAAAFVQVLDRLIRLSSPQPTDACVDLGAGTGFVTTALRGRLNLGHGTSSSSGKFPSWSRGVWGRH